MDIQAYRLELIQRLGGFTSESHLLAIGRFFERLAANESAQAVQPMTWAELQEKLDRAAEDIKAGRLYSSEEVRKKFS